jgi:hypothetical protein
MPALRAHVRNAANNTAFNMTTARAIPWDTEDADVGGWHSTSVNTSRMTVPAGYNITRVDLSAHVLIYGTGNIANFAKIRTYFLKNGTTVVGGGYANNKQANTAVTDHAIQMSAFAVSCVAGDYFEVFVFCDDSGADLHSISYFTIKAVYFEEQALVPQIQTAPVISGTIVTGQTLSCTTGVWTGTPTSYAYQWKSNGVNIGGATNSTFVLTGAESGTYITCAVTPTNHIGVGQAATSNTVGWVDYDAYAEATASSGSVSAIGNYTYATKIFAVDNGATVTSIGYYTTGAKSITVKLFRRNSVNNYTVVAEKDYSHLGSGWEDVTLDTPYIVPATGDYYAGLYTSGVVNYLSNTTRALVAGNLTGTGTLTDDSNNNTPNIRVNGFKKVGLPVNTVSVAISGTASEGSTLTATPGTWTGSGIALTYQWYADSVAISGATNSTYVLTSSELGKVITVYEIATNVSGSVGKLSAESSHVIPTGETTYSESTGTSNSVTTSNQTWLNTTMVVDNDSFIQRVGIYQTFGNNVTVKIAIRDSAGTYTVVASETFYHTGSGWEELKLTTPCTIPSSGTHYAGMYSSGSFNYIGNARAYIGADATGTSSGWTETGANTSCVRVKGYK